MVGIGSPILLVPLRISKLAFCSRLPAQNDGVAVGVLVGVWVAVAVFVAVLVRVCVAVLVAVAVGVLVGVTVGAPTALTKSTAEPNSMNASPL
jgi:hypothetical protein